MKGRATRIASPPRLGFVVHVQSSAAIDGRVRVGTRRPPANGSTSRPAFFAGLKKELVHDADFATRREARAAIFEYIEVFYNNQRLHSSLGYVTPAAYEQPR
jgi:transposase InsO family protein